MAAEFEQVKWEDILSSNKEIDIIISKNQFQNVLNDLGNEVDDEGRIIDKETKEPVLAQDKGQIEIDEFGGVLSGSKGFIKKNIASFSEFLAEKRH